MKGQKLPSEDHLVRYVQWAKLRKDEDDNVIGILGEAFRRRVGEETLSCTWLEYFNGTRLERITAAVHAIRASELKPGGKSGFAIGNVGAVSATCASRNHKVRMLHEPADDNKAHAVVRRLPRDDIELLELFATETWAELVLNSSIPAGDAPAP